MYFLDTLHSSAQDALETGHLAAAETAVQRLLELTPDNGPTHSLFLDVQKLRRERKEPYLFPAWLGPALCVDDVQGLLTEGDVAALRHAASRTSGLALTIGVFHGLGMHVVAQANPSLRQVGIDACRGISGQLDTVVTERLEIAQKNLARLPDARLVVAFSTDAAKDWQEIDGGSIDLLTIDGDHSPRSALNDLRDWAPLVRPGGRIAIHDAYARFSPGVARYRRIHEGDGPDIISAILEACGGYELELVSGCTEIWRKETRNGDKKLAAMIDNPVIPELTGPPEALDLYGRGEYGQALDILDTAMKTARRPSPLAELVPEVLFLRASCLRALGRMEEARRDASEVCKRQPSDQAQRMVAELDFILARNNGLEISNLRRELRGPADSLARLAKLDNAQEEIVDAARSLERFLDRVGELERGWKTEYAARPAAWSMGYLLAKQDVLEVLAQEAVAGQPLPAKPFGPGLDERVVEIPWALAGLGESRRVLDAGSALNHPGVLENLRDRDVTIATLYPERYRDDSGVSYVYEDLRDLPFKDGWFDAVVCLSTIEHIGHATEGYKAGKDLKSKDTARGGDVAAVIEMMRVTKPGGRILISAPFGDPASGGADYKVYDEPAVNALVQGSGGRLESLEFYHFTPEGWIPSSARECRNIPYRGNGSPGAGAVFLLTLVA